MNLTLLLVGSVMFIAASLTIGVVILWEIAIQLKRLVNAQEDIAEVDRLDLEDGEQWKKDS